MNVAIAPLAPRVYVWSVVLTVVLPVLVAVIAMAFTHKAGTARLAMAIGGICVPLGVGLIWLVSRHQLEMVDGGLSVRAAFYSLALRRDELVPDGVRRVDLGAPGAPRASLRTNGIALPGYQAGWFRMKDGSKAFLLVTGKEAVLIPTRRGFDLLLTPRDAQALVDQLGS